MKTFPTTEEGLESLLSAPEDEDVAKNWAGPYLDGKKLPIDPWEPRVSMSSVPRKGAKPMIRPRFTRLARMAKPTPMTTFAIKAPPKMEKRTEHRRGNAPSLNDLEEEI